jgi:glycosyltransferase involved in cell wall biosynthesis
MFKKVAIIGTNGLPGRYGGWDQLVNHITNNLRNKHSFFVYTSYFNAERGLKEYNGAKLKIIYLKANGIQSILYDIISLIHSVFYCDVLFICGTSGCIFLPIIRLFRKKIILNPDGSEWKRGKWSKPVQWFLRISERMGIKYSDIVVADNKKIKEYISDTYKKESVLIEYGGDNASYVPMSIETERKYDVKSDNYAFKVCRIEPENNIDMILEAFKDSSLIFVLVGNWNNSNYGMSVRLKYSIYPNLRLLDPIYDQKSLDELRSNCCLYIHGHSVGGTNPSLVEAMNLGLFIVAYDVVFNIETTENKALYFKSVHDLKQILANLEEGKFNINSYKENMREIASRRYLWSIITEKYSLLFSN